MIPVSTSVPVTRMPARADRWPGEALMRSEAVGRRAATSARLVASKNPIEDDDGATLTGAPLTFICTDALPSVRSSLEAVSVGIRWPLAKIWPGISRLPDPSTRHT